MPRVSRRVHGVLWALALALAANPARAEPTTPRATDAATIATSTTSTSSVTHTTTVSEEWRELQASRTSSTSTAAYTLEGDATPAPTITAEPPRPPARLRLLYTGGSYGIGGGRYRFELPERLAETVASAGGRITSVRAYHGVFVQGLAVIVAEDHRVETVVDMITEGGITCGVAENATSVRAAQERLLYVGPEPRGAPFVAELRGLSRRRYEVRRCTSASGHAARLFMPLTGRTPIVWSLDELEIRLGLFIEVEQGGRVHGLELVGIPADEPARRFRMLSELARAPGTLWVDAGSFLDGASTVRDGELSAHRPLGYEMITRLGPAALVPGETELLAGARRFLEELRARGLPYVATNWAPADPALELPEVILRDVETSRGVVRVAFLGIVDPKLRELVPVLKTEGVVLEDPIAALHRTVRSLNEGEAHPDLYVVSTIAGPDVTSEIATRVRGIDLVIGDRALSTRSRRLELDVRPDASLRRSVAAVLPISGVSSAELELMGDAEPLLLRRVTVEPQRTTDSLEADPFVRGTITKNRARLYPELDHPLVAAPASDDPLATMSFADWRRLVCEATLAATSADVVLLPSLPPPDLAAPGPLTELLVANRLGTLDRLEAHWIPGSKLLDVLRLAADVVPTSCGADIGVRAGAVVRGRAIDPDSVYLVVTTDRGRVLGLDRLFESAYSRRALDRRGPVPVVGEGGATLTLRAAVISALRALRDASGTTYAPLDALLTPSVSKKRPQWTLRLSRVSLRLERFQGAEDDAFAAVPEAQATAPSSLTLGAELDLSLAFDSTSVIADLRLRTQYARLEVEAESAATQEPNDDVRLSSSASLPGVMVGIGPLSLMPFTEVLFDTEVTPIERDGAELPRQLDLSLTLGVSAAPGPYLKIIRLGGFVLGDLAATNRSAQAGGRAEVQAVVVFGPELRFESLLDARVFADTGDDDAGDLRVRSQLDARLALPLVRWLSVAVYGRAFAFSGRVEPTEHLGLSYTFGFSFDLGGAFRL